MRSYPVQPYPQDPYVDPAYLLASGNVYRENIPQGRFGALSDLAVLTTQVMLTVAIPLQKGDVVTALTWRSGGTAANTPTNWWTALYNPAGALMAQSADQTNTAWAADDHKTVALATPQRIAEAGAYFAAIMVKASAPPSLVGLTLDHAEVSDGYMTGHVNLSQTSGSSLTDTAPATIATPSAVVGVPYVVAS